MDSGWIDGWISLCTTAVQLGMMSGWIQIGLIDGWILDKSCYQGPNMLDTWMDWGRWLVVQANQMLTNEPIWRPFVCPFHPSLFFI